MDGLRTIGDAFNECSSLKEITIPNTVISIADGIFDPEKITIRCFPASHAFSYAKKNKIPYTFRSEELENLSSVSEELIAPGENVTVICFADGEELQYRYSVYYKKSGSSDWITVQGYKPNCIVKWILNTPGTYDIRVNVADASGTVVRKDLSVKVASNLQNVSKLGAT